MLMKWKEIIESGGFLTPNEAGNLLMGEDSIKYQLREALNLMLYPRDYENRYTYDEIMMMIDDIIVELPNGVHVGILDVLESGIVKVRVPEITQILSDFLYYEKWLGD